MEVIALKANSVFTIVVYLGVCLLCLHTLVTRHSNRLVKSFLSLAGLASLAVTTIHALSVLGLLPLPLHPLVSGNFFSGAGAIIGLSAFIIRRQLTRPR